MYSMYVTGAMTAMTGIMTGMLVGIKDRVDICRDSHDRCNCG